MSCRQLGFGLLLCASFATALAGCAAAPRGEKEAAKPAEVAERIVEAGCSTCIFNLNEPGCSLAVRIDGKIYLVRGSDLDDHGDAHAPEGMCMMARHARVTGHTQKDVFIAERFELLPRGSAP
jgi:hypothetical protein